uniref:Uncharacterized protein n=1 Tax=Moniliophthora roreri TaxID=221103 RepID=A0A0W0G8V8_MONRR
MSSFDPNLDDVGAAIAYLQRSPSPADLDLLSERAYYWTFRGQEEYFGGLTDSWLSTFLPSEHHPVTPWKGLDSEPSDSWLSKFPSPSPSHGHGVLPTYYCYSSIRRGAAPIPRPSPTFQASTFHAHAPNNFCNFFLQLQANEASITDTELHPHPPKRPRTSTPKHGHAHTVTPDIDTENAPKYPSPTPSTSLQVSEQLTEPSSESFSSSKLKSKSPTKVSYQVAIPLKSILKPKLGTLDTNVIDSLARIGRLSSSTSALIPIPVSPSSNPNDSGSLDLLKPKLPENVADLDSLAIPRIGTSTAFEATAENIIPIQNQNDIAVHSLDCGEPDRPDLVHSSMPTPRSQTRNQTRALRKRSLKSDDSNPTPAPARSRKTSRTSTPTSDAPSLRRSTRHRGVKDTSDARSTGLTPASKKSKAKTDVLGSDSPLTDLSD